MAGDSWRHGQGQGAAYRPQPAFGDRRRTVGVAQDVEGGRPSRVYQGRRLRGRAIQCRGTQLAQVDLCSARRWAFPVAPCVNPHGRRADDIAKASQSLGLLAQRLPVGSEIGEEGGRALEERVPRCARVSSAA